MAPKAPTSKTRTFHIAGAGIAGLTLALALAKHGARVTVLERNDSVQEFGAGLQISPNARRALNTLGLDDAIRAVSLEPEGIDIYPFGHKKPLTTLELGRAARERYGVPYAVMHRADLVDTLFSACKRFANIDIRFNIRNFDVTTSSKGTTLTIDAPEQKSSTAHAFAFIGADGVGSHTRTKILGGTEATYSGYVAWRTLIDIGKLAPEFSTAHTSVMWGPGFHAVAYPLPHRGQTNIALFVKESMSVAFGIRETPNLPKLVQHDPRFAKILQSTDVWTHWPLAAVKTPRWHQGPIGIIGDAAHAMLPFQAQGAAMAIEDAVILAQLLMTEQTGETAFQRFDEIRRERVTRTAAISATNGRIFHLHQPFSLGRNLVVKLQGKTGHFTRLDWLYAYDPASI